MYSAFYNSLCDYVSLSLVGAQLILLRGTTKGRLAMDISVNAPRAGGCWLKLAIWFAKKTAGKIVMQITSAMFQEVKDDIASEICC